MLTEGALRVKVIEADPADDAVLACAIEGHADCVVSGDSHLLDLGVHAGIPIITARAFLDILSRSTPETG